MKGYIKDSNGKFHLVEKDENGKQEPQVIINPDPVKTLNKKNIEKLKENINKAFDAMMLEAFH